MNEVTAMEDDDGGQVSTTFDTTIDECCESCHKMVGCNGWTFISGTCSVITDAAGSGGDPQQCANGQSTPTFILGGRQEDAGGNGPCAAAY